MKFTKPRCVLVYALAPDTLRPADANRLMNEFVADRTLPLVLYHDHFIEKRGGLAIFFVSSVEERDALENTTHLEGWHVEFRPLIYSYSPAAFDEQIAYTLNAYRGRDWQELRAEERPAYGDPRAEADSAEES
jgi:hypothetical protein